MLTAEVVARAAALLEGFQASGSGNLSLAQGRAFLAVLDLPSVPGELLRSPEELEGLAGRLPFPWVLKAVSPDMSHKSDLGGVKVNINSLQEARQAFQALIGVLEARMPQARREGVWVEGMVNGAVEVLVATLRDLEFGPLLAFGSGGKLVEVLNDVAYAVTPVTRDDILEMIAETRAAGLLAGARDLPPADLGKLAAFLEDVAGLLPLFPYLKEVELNPVFVRGGEILISDVRMAFN